MIPISVRSERSLSLLGAIALSFLPGAIRAQGVGAVAGTVTLAGTGEGVPGVRVGLPGLPLEGVADEQGRFGFESIPVGEHELRAEVVGCVPLSLTVDVTPGERTVLVLTLDGPAVLPRASRLAAATGLPYTVERLEREDLARKPSPSIVDLIRGAFPGVKVVQGSGLPGSKLSIQFRGPGSISGDREPLVVVDGMITGGGLDDLDPADVERIEVLKGSASAAIYGARGQTGVIEITTRSGASTAAPRCFLRTDPST
jgi:TonB-dependent SusC/RagA subfamily outer membrane receptor